MNWTSLFENPVSHWKRIPKTIGVLAAGQYHANAPVTKVELYPPGKHPERVPIRSDVMLAVIHTPYGKRYYGFADGYIDSGLRASVKLLPGQERDQVVAEWPRGKPKPRPRKVRWDPNSGARERLFLLSQVGPESVRQFAWKFDPSRDVWTGGWTGGSSSGLRVTSEGSESLAKIERVFKLSRREAMELIGMPER